MSFTLIVCRGNPVLRPSAIHFSRNCEGIAPLFASTLERRNEKFPFKLNIYFPRVGIDLTTCRTYATTGLK